MTCRFDNPTQTCPACGYRAKRMPTYRQCRRPEPPPWRPIMVGDVLERWLRAAGLTKERIERWTRTAGRPDGCGCEARKRWLNEYGAAVQTAVRAGWLALGRFYFPT